MTSWSDPVFAELAELATRRAGLAFPPGRVQSAEAAMRHAMQRADVSDARKYLDLLTTGLLSSDGLLFELTVGETYFFRQREHFALIAREILPDIRRRHGDTHDVQVWSAGCSSGEEAYSLAIALADSQVNGHVLGTDVSDIALAKARVGEYRPWSLRELDAAETGRLFRAHGRHSRLDERYRGSVTFARHNLATDAYPPAQRPVEKYDLILCRNVLLYLDQASVNRVTEGLAESLADEGWLLTGASDPLLTHPDLRVSTSHGCVVYRRHPRVAVTPPDHRLVVPDARPSIDGSYKASLTTGMSDARRNTEAPPIGAGSPEDAQAVLDERARRLALPVAVADAREFIEVLTFTVGATRYALEYGWVQEVVRFATVTPVPGTPAFVVGVTNYRGQILCLFDLRGLLRLPTAPLNDLARIVVMGSGAPEFGLLADRTEDTRRLIVTDIVASTDPTDASGSTLARGITPDGVVVLDGSRLLRDTRLVIDRTW